MTTQKNKHFLVVDDELSTLKLLQKILKRIGYDVTIKKNGADAYRSFMKQPDEFDLVITDLTMSDMNGDMLARKLTQIRPDIPIILCTGNSSFISQEKVGKSDFKDFVLKPFTIKDITHTIQEVLDKNKIIHMPEH